MKKVSFLLFVSIIGYSCENEINKAHEKKQIKRNNVVIDYSQCGEGDTTLLFLHGWCINKEYWEAQVKDFCNRYNVVTVDLPGFGKSGKNRDNWSFEEYGWDVKTVIDSLQLKNVILIGHSMSGDILLQADTQYPEAITGIVGVDNLKDTGRAFTSAEKKDIDDFFVALSANYKSTVEGYARTRLFHSSTDSVVINRVVNDFRNADSVIAIKVLRSSLDAFQKEADLMQQLSHKLFLINSDASPTNVAGLNKYCKNSCEVLLIHAIGHYPMIEKPAEFNAALMEVIKRLVNGVKSADNKVP